MRSLYRDRVTRLAQGSPVAGWWRSGCGRAAVGPRRCAIPRWLVAGRTPHLALLRTPQHHPANVAPPMSPAQPLPESPRDDMGSFAKSRCRPPVSSQGDSRGIVWVIGDRRDSSRGDSRGQVESVRTFRFRHVEIRPGSSEESGIWSVACRALSNFVTWRFREGWPTWCRRWGEFRQCRTMGVDSRRVATTTYGLSAPTTHIAKNWLPPPYAWPNALRTPST